MKHAFFGPQLWFLKKTLLLPAVALRISTKHTVKPQRRERDQDSWKFPMNFDSFCLRAVIAKRPVVGCVRNIHEFQCFLHCFFYRWTWWCPEVGLEFRFFVVRMLGCTFEFLVSRGSVRIFQVSRGPFSILTFGCPEVRLDLWLLVRDVENLDPNFRYEVPIKFLDRPLDTAFWTHTNSLCFFFVVFVLCFLHRTLRRPEVGIELWILGVRRSV